MSQNPNNSVLDHYKKEILALINQGSTQIEVCEHLIKFGVYTSPTSIRRALKRWSETPSLRQVVKETSDAVKAGPTSQKRAASLDLIDRAERKLAGEETVDETLQRELTKTKADVKRLLKVVNGYEALFDNQNYMVERIISSIQDQPQIPGLDKYPSIMEGEDPHEMLALISDAHYGETVNDLFGVEYNPSVCEHRLKHLAEKIVRFWSMRTQVFPVNKITLAFLGDMISGEIHDEITETNHFPVSDQIVFMAHLMRDMILYISEYVPQVDVIIQFGNHARMTKEARHKAKYNNHEYVMGKMVEALVADRENVNVVVPKDIAYVHEILGHRIAMVHGDGPKSSLTNVPFNALDRKRVSFQTALRSFGIEQADFFVMGHFHQLVWWPGKGCDMIINGSIKGPDEYAFDTMYTAEEAQQALLTFNRKHGITAFERINLSKIN